MNARAKPVAIALSFLAFLALPVAADVSVPGSGTVEESGEPGGADGHDFRNAPQLYCNGTCSYAGAQDCDQADADLFCKLLTGNPKSVALSFKVRTALPRAGFACPEDKMQCHGKICGKNLGPMPSRGVRRNVHYQSTSILENHGAGNVIVEPKCSR